MKLSWDMPEIYIKMRRRRTKYTQFNISFFNTLWRSLDLLCLLMSFGTKTTYSHLPFIFFHLLKHWVWWTKSKEKPLLPHFDSQLDFHWIVTFNSLNMSLKKTWISHLPHPIFLIQKFKASLFSPIFKFVFQYSLSVPYE